MNEQRRIFFIRKIILLSTHKDKMAIPRFCKLMETLFLDTIGNFPFFPHCFFRAERGSRISFCSCLHYYCCNFYTVKSMRSRKCNLACLPAFVWWRKCAYAGRGEKKDWRNVCLAYRQLGLWHSSSEYEGKFALRGVNLLRTTRTHFPHPIVFQAKR